ncbi:molybdopterin molybdotransferase MoeA [Sporolactobacillus shoreae]|uniref:Molybdopterin molybdenumtransferase n=1 Tax=Sporolactobacillus shoreae TaxID=1465501 RepID=A0A4Z0GUC1_9BACL|nr:gephyrin-like molybdotransferase Glp [Sporolactobacillus shoreae]TGA99902.1 molybdopterin molybdotransferase MoeA [Sporolactobacillus shoreae]
MVEKRKPIPVSEAVAAVMHYALSGSPETVALEESYGRYLGEDLIADHDVPHFDRSRYDGYAVRSQDLTTASPEHPVTLEVIEEIGAGFIASKEIKPFQTVRIMTGAQMPDQCDAAIMFELTEEYEKSGRKFIDIDRPIKSGSDLFHKGEDMKNGALLFPKGTYINPGICAVLATFGYASVKVMKKPRIGIFATGTELLDVDEPLVPGKIRNSNASMLQAQLRRAGAEPLYLGKLIDDFDVSYKAVSSALEDLDLLITSGGVSVGDFDYLPAIYKKLGAEVLFNKVAMRPGSVTTVAELNGKLLYGLSGNPSSCYVGFELLVRPVIKSLLASKDPHLKKIRAKFQGNFPANSFSRFIRSHLAYGNDGLEVVPVGADKPNMVSTLASSDALSVLPGGSNGFSKGDVIDVLLLESNEGSKWPW